VTTTELFYLQPDANEFTALADNLPEAAWIARADGWILWYNRQWYNYTGKTPSEMEGWGWQSVHHPDSLPDVLERWKNSITTGEPFEMVFPLRGADGVFRSFLTRVRPWRDDKGQICRWFGSNTEITVQQKVAAELSEQKYVLETLNRTAAVIAVEFNQHKLVQTVTDAAVDLTKAQFGAFFYNLTNEKGESYTLYAISGVSREKFSKFPMPRNTEVFESSPASRLRLISCFSIRVALAQKIAGRARNRPPTDPPARLLIQAVKTVAAPPSTNRIRYSY
jgi:PAS domain S-box-containing protein